MPLAVELHGAVAARIGHTDQGDGGQPPLRPVVLDEALIVDVRDDVAVEHQERVAVLQEVRRLLYGSSRAQRPLLPGVDYAEVELRRAEIPHERLGHVVDGEDRGIDASLREVLQGPVQHRLVGQGEQHLRAGAAQRPQPRAEPSNKNEGLQSIHRL